jgi:hypothetical protein
MRSGIFNIGTKSLQPSDSRDIMEQITNAGSWSSPDKTRFQDLPAEIRIYIWKLALPQRRIFEWVYGQEMRPRNGQRTVAFRVPHKCNPAVLYVCRESYDTLIGEYILLGGRYRFNTSTDMMLSQPLFNDPPDELPKIPGFEKVQHVACNLLIISMTYRSNIDSSEVSWLRLLFPSMKTLSCILTALDTHCARPKFPIAVQNLRRAKDYEATWITNWEERKGLEYITTHWDAGVRHCAREGDRYSFKVRELRKLWDAGAFLEETYGRTVSAERKFAKKEDIKFHVIYAIDGNEADGCSITGKGDECTRREFAKIAKEVFGIPDVIKENDGRGREIVWKGCSKYKTAKTTEGPLRYVMVPPECVERSAGGFQFLGATGEKEEFDEHEPAVACWAEDWTLL